MKLCRDCLLPLLECLCLEDNDERMNWLPVDEPVKDGSDEDE